MKHGIIPWDYPKPLVAAVNGAAVAGGFELMMACDLVVAAEHAVFGVAEVKRGLLPGGGGTLLATRIPLALALEITLTGDTSTPRGAFDIGLVNRVVPADRVLDEALALGEPHRGERTTGGPGREAARSPRRHRRRVGGVALARRHRAGLRQ